MKPWMQAVAAGAAIGFAYTMSPLTVVFAGALVPLWRWVSQGLTGTERRWLLAVLAIAVALRVLVIGGLFLSADPNIPYANFFGDEEFFKRRTTWMRNLGMGIPISTADYFYAFDETGRTSYLYVLSYVQALFGLAPYGIHLFNAGLYLAAGLVLHKLVRPSFGGLTALVGLVVLLLLPSLFIWSISALKEPMYFLVVSINLAAVVAVMRSRSWMSRAAAVLVAIGGALLLQTIREGGLAISAVGIIGGLSLAFLMQRPRLLAASAVVAPLLIVFALSQPAVQARVWSGLHEAAFKHWGHVNTPGLTYKILDDRFYPDRNLVPTMTAAEGARFVIRAVHSYLTVPLPWQIESRSALAFLPEQMIWFVLILLIPAGLVSGFRRDTLLTSLLLVHGCAVSMMVALSGGNIGTLVRHRGLALPYLVWLSGLGAVTLAQFILSSSDSKAGHA